MALHCHLLAIFEKIFPYYFLLKQGSMHYSYFCQLYNTAGTSHCPFHCAFHRCCSCCQHVLCRHHFHHPFYSCIRPLLPMSVIACHPFCHSFRPLLPFSCCCWHCTLLPSSHPTSLLPVPAAVAIVHHTTIASVISSAIASDLHFGLSLLLLHLSITAVIPSVVAFASC